MRSAQPACTKAAAAGGGPKAASEQADAAGLAYSRMTASEQTDRLSAALSFMARIRFFDPARHSVASATADDPGASTSAARSDAAEATRLVAPPPLLSDSQDAPHSSQSRRVSSEVWGDDAEQDGGAKHHAAWDADNGKRSLRPQEAKRERISLEEARRRGVRSSQIKKAA